MNFDFDAWWKEMKPAECDEFKPYFEESWQLGFKDGYEKGVAAFHEAVKIENPDMTHPLFHVAGESFECIPDAEGEAHNASYVPHIKENLNV